MASIPLNFYDLVETFPQPGCALCRMIEHDVERFLDSQMYEYVNTPDTHFAMRDSRGLCATHSAQLIDYGAQVLGIAILDASVLGEVMKLVDQHSSRKPGNARWWSRSASPGSALADVLEPTRSCMACDKLEQATRLHIHTFVTYLADPRIQDAFRASSGLCLPHYQMALRESTTPALTETLTTIQMNRWEKLKAELDLFADKYDIRRADIAMGAEGDSWRRALALISGSPRLFGLRGGR